MSGRDATALAGSGTPEVSNASRGWWLYVLLCEGDKLYVGIARDPDARFAVHCSGRGAFYTRLNRPVRILAREWYPTQSAALKAEYSLKQRKTDEKWAWTRLVTAPR